MKARYIAIVLLAAFFAWTPAAAASPFSKREKKYFYLYRPSFADSIASKTGGKKEEKEQIEKAVRNAFARYAAAVQAQSDYNADELINMKEGLGALRSEKDRAFQQYRLLANELKAMTDPRAKSSSDPELARLAEAVSAAEAETDSLTRLQAEVTARIAATRSMMSAVNDSIARLTGRIDELRGAVETIDAVTRKMDGEVQAVHDAVASASEALASARTLTGLDITALDEAVSRFGSKGALVKNLDPAEYDAAEAEVRIFGQTKKLRDALLKAVKQMSEACSPTDNAAVAAEINAASAGLVLTSSQSAEVAAIMRALENQAAPYEAFSALLDEMKSTIGLFSSDELRTELGADKTVRELYTRLHGFTSKETYPYYTALTAAASQIETDLSPEPVPAQKSVAELGIHTEAGFAGYLSEKRKTLKIK